MYNSKKRGGLSRDEKRMELFWDVLTKNRLMDLSYSSPWFTWERGNTPETNVRERLDKGVANEEWFLRFTTASIKHLSHAMSNHYPLLLNLFEDGKRKGVHGFRFEAWWIMKPLLKVKWGKSKITIEVIFLPN